MKKMRSGMVIRGLSRGFEVFVNGFDFEDDGCC